MEGKKFHFIAKEIWYEKCKKLFSNITVGVFEHEKIRYMGIYFPRYFITTAEPTVMAEANECLGKYITICLILDVRKNQSICDKILIAF